MLKYLKAAALYHWNLLLFGGAMGFAALSGQPDVAVPIVLAAETAYLGFLGTHDKFQRHVDAQEAKASRSSESQRSGEVLTEMLKKLPDHSRRRYANLLGRCRSLRQIAADLKHSSSAEATGSLDSLQNEGLDRLLWMFMRLLFTEYSLSRFLEQTSRDDIEMAAEEIKAQIAARNPADKSPHAEKVRRALEDSLATANNRLDNYDRAKSNHEFVQLEIDRLESKIEALAELAVNRQEPDYISSQIDQVAHSMQDTEKTMSELKYITGVELMDDAVPAVMQTTVQ